MRSFSLGMLAIMMMAPLASVSLTYADTGSTAVAADTAVSAALTESLTAAPTIPAMAGSSLGEYKSVSWASRPEFGISSCNQCFDGASIKVGTRMTGLFDNWTNSSTNVLKAIKDEQKMPNMVKFGASIWSSTPTTESAIWKYSSDVIWTNVGSGTKQEFLLQPGSKVRFLEADLGAGYTLDKTDRKNGELVGMLRFPVISHAIDVRTASEGAANTHYECVAYKLDTPVVTPATPVTPVKPVPPKEMTKTETGPETLLLIAAAFFIAFGLMFTLRRRV